MLSCAPESGPIVEGSNPNYYPTCPRNIVTELQEDEHFETILPDSSANAAVFPSAFARVSQKVSGEYAKLRDAQGRSIPVEEMRNSSGGNA